MKREPTLNTPRKNELEGYYAQRAKEYEAIYYRQDPIRQAEQLEIQTALKETLAGKEVVEIACGTGYWTQYLSETAAGVVATDFNQEVLDIAATKNFKCPVSLQRADAYNLPFEDGRFTGATANFWFSHIPKDKIDIFLRGFHRVVKSGSPIFIADNVYIPDVGGELIIKPNDVNTYKIRTLADGTKHEVLKNYFSSQELFDIFRKYDRNFSEKDISHGQCFWYLHYNTNA